MFYIKTEKPNGKTLKTEITDENVFTLCPECGVEMNIDLAELFSDGEGDLHSSSVACSACTMKRYKKPLVYIASPFADRSPAGGDTETNIRRAQGYCRFAVANNCIPIAPHLHYPQFMDDSDKEQRELGLFFALVLLGKCDELWAFGDHITNGMAQELKKAEKRGIPIKRFSSKCEEVGMDGVPHKNIRL